MQAVHGAVNALSLAWDFDVDAVVEARLVLEGLAIAIF